MIVLITGPVRSGKSTRAVGLAREFGLPVTHVLTARVDPDDREMADRLAHHRAERGADPAIELWQPGGHDLAAIVAAAPARSTLLIDSLGTWVAGHMLAFEELIEREPADALARLSGLLEPALVQIAQSSVVVVAEETGWGLVPVTAQGRLFRDILGRVIARIGRRADRIELVVAGFALDVRRLGVPVGS
jgi:adenosylcobinamide kinase/adenosylcobinamide-phosphate guanylyltransferase